MFTRSRVLSQGGSGERSETGQNQNPALQSQVQAPPRGQEDVIPTTQVPDFPLDEETSPTLVTQPSPTSNSDCTIVNPTQPVSEGTIVQGEMHLPTLRSNPRGDEQNQGGIPRTLGPNLGLQLHQGNLPSALDTMRTDLTHYLQRPQAMPQQAGTLPTQLISVGPSISSASSASYGWSAPIPDIQRGPPAASLPTSSHPSLGWNPETTSGPGFSTSTSHLPNPLLGSLVPNPNDLTSTPITQPMNGGPSLVPHNYQSGSAGWFPQPVSHMMAGQIFMPNSCPPLVSELSVKKVTEHKKLFEVHFIQSQGRGVHACGYLSSDARRILAILCKAHGVPDYSDHHIVNSLGMTSAEWYKRVLSILHAQFPSEREEENLKLRSIAGFMQWIAAVTKYYEENDPSYEQALRIVLDGLKNFEQEQGLLRNAMVQRARNQRSCTREDIIYEVTSILHFSNLFDRKRPHEESRASNANKRMTTSSSSGNSNNSNKQYPSNYRNQGRLPQPPRNNPGSYNHRRYDNRSDGSYNRGYGHYSNRSGQSTPNTSNPAHLNSNSTNSTNQLASVHNPRRFNPNFQGRPPNSNQGETAGGVGGNNQGPARK